MNEFFDDFYNFKGFGPAIKTAQPNQATLTKYQGKLPARLLEYWQEYGFSGWGAGRFWVVNPEDYQDILDTWLAGTPFVEQDSYYVIGRSAFGRLFIWGETSGRSITINANYGMIFPTDSTENLAKRGPERSIDLFFACLSQDEMDTTDLDEVPLFERALEKLGELEADEMYGFVPALALGGAPTLAHLQKVKAMEHLAFIAELGEKRVMADIVALSNQLPHNQKT